MFQLHYHAIRPATTAHLAQTMTLLSLTVEELRQQIESELANNPALEMVDERRCPTCHRRLPDHGACPLCSRPSLNGSDEPVVFISPQEEYSYQSSASKEVAAENDYSAMQDDLPTYVLRQVAPELEGQDRKIAAYILANLDEDGLLGVTLLEIARYFHVMISDVQRVQKIIQRADPIGVGSSSPREALLAQLDVLEENGSIPRLARSIVEDGMELMSRRQFGELARQLGVNLKQVEQTVDFIGGNLNPFPARSHWGDVRQPEASVSGVYHQPDIIVSYLNEDPGNPLMVEIILPLRGILRVNPMFRQALREASEEKKEEWKSDLERASLFVKCLQQRNHTIQRLLTRLVGLQKDFILNGDEYLRPITRAFFSKELEVHESTISRAVANKTIQLPNKRIIPLAAFFDRSLNVRTVLKDLIDREHRPLSDAELADLLAERGYPVARRTVAKYRAMEGILPAHLRQAALQGTP